MATSIVVKVRYGETLRRFNANLNEAGQLELDIGGLREKVIGLFNLAPTAEITITYIDEDGDVVTLADEEDLLDVISQSLNPLRLTVTCKAEKEKDGQSNARSSGDSTPMRSPRTLENLNCNVSEMLKSVPEPFREPISKLSQDLATKAASSVPMLAPGFADLVDSLTKMGQSIADGSKPRDLNVNSGTGITGSLSVPVVPGLVDLVNSLTKMGQSQAEGSKPRDLNVASGSGIAGSKTGVPVASKDDGASLETARGMKFEDPTTKADKSNVLNAPVSNPMNACSSLLSVPWLPMDVKNGASNHAIGHGVKKAGNTGECYSTVEAGKSASVNPTAENIKDTRKSGKEWSYFTPGVYPACAGKDAVVGSGPTNGGGNTQFPDLNLVNEWPFTGMQVEKDAAVSGPPRVHPQFGARVHPFKRSYNHNDGLSGIFHRGVRCDGCGVHPITGPRFKSKVKEDYDLCSVCFSQMGNASDYNRMDRPASYHHPHAFRGAYEPRFRLPTLQHVVRGAGLKASRPKLDSRFIKDVNVMDGTMMAPSTPFTKIWRMKNNGTIVWPHGSQLVWIGGDKLSDATNAELQIQVGGVAVDGELDVAVDFTAPKTPGRYISYWRMASPSGQKFGQRVWVLIQVDAALEDSLLDSFQGLNLNLPPEGSNEAGSEYNNVKSESVLVEPENVSGVNPFLESLLGASSDTPSVEPLVEAAKSGNENMPVPIYLDTSLFGGVLSSTPPPAEAEAAKAVAYPVVDSSAVEQPKSSCAAASTSSEVPVTVEGASGSSDLEESLLKELEDMGFKQADLNKEILRKNGYDLGQSVDDLCGVAEWDPILEELHEMGFHDKEVNKRLLKKNNGSIKGVVMDLITAKKDD